jgi:hypothetical protein
MRNGLLNSKLQKLEDACRAAKSELACSLVLLVRNVEVLVDSLERNGVLKEELSQLRGGT